MHGAGRADEAITFARESVEHHRGLFLHDPVLHSAGLAAALDNLANRLGANLGHYQEAISVAEEAGDLFRELASIDADSGLEGLASSLNNRSVWQGRLGYDAASLKSALGCVAARRRLATENPALYSDALASALTSLSTRLEKAGQREESIAAAQEAVGILQRLAETDATHRADLAHALHNLGNRLTGTEAVGPGERAVAVYRQLCEADDGDRREHHPRLALSLRNLAISLDEAGQGLDAVDPAYESVKLYRELVDSNPDAHLPSLATALTSLSTRLEKAGQREESIADAQEAVGILQRLAETDATHRADLAHALHNLGNRLTGTEAVGPGERAVAVYRQLCEADDGDRREHLPALALSCETWQSVWTKQGKALMPLIRLTSP